MDKLKAWAVCAGVRAVKTGAQTLAGCIGTSAVNIVSLDWPQMLGIAGTAMVVSVCMSVAGLPEVEGGASVASIAKGGGE